MLFIYHGETPLVNCGPRSILLHLNTIYCNRLLSAFLTSNYHLPHYTVSFQQAGEIDTLTVTLGQSFLVVLCAGAVSSPTGSITLVSSQRENLLLHSSYLPLGVSQRTCDLHVSSTFSGTVARDLRSTSGSSCVPVNSTPWNFFWRRCRGLETLLISHLNSCNNTFSGTVDKDFFWRHSHQAAARGVSHFQTFYFVIVLLSILLLCIVCFLYQKSKKISYLFYLVITNRTYFSLKMGNPEVEVCSSK